MKKAKCCYISTTELKSDMAKSDTSRVLLKEIDHLPLLLPLSLNYGLLKFNKIFTCWKGKWHIPQMSKMHKQDCIVLKSKGKSKAKTREELMKKTIIADLWNQEVEGFPGMPSVPSPAISLIFSVNRSTNPAFPCFVFTYSVPALGEKIIEMGFRAEKRLLLIKKIQTPFQHHK